MDEPALFSLPGPTLGPIPDGIRALAGRLPGDLALGTSSWSFPGWPIWGSRGFANELLAREGLEAYAEHPLHGAVGVDRSWHAPVDETTWRSYREQVPDNFRFLVKAHQDVTWARFPDHRRYGGRAGRLNGHFLDAGFTTEVCIEPMMAGLGDLRPVLLFQFPPQAAFDLGEEGFCERLALFLQALPDGPRYAVELRHKQFFGPRYVEALREGDALHCLAIHPACPDLRTQWAQCGVGTQPELLVRWSLSGGTYARERARFAPFEEVQSEVPDLREKIAKACIWAADSGRPALVIANNKAEGCAPLTLQGLAETIDALRS